MTLLGHGKYVLLTDSLGVRESRDFFFRAGKVDDDVQVAAVLTGGCHAAGTHNLSCARRL